MFELYTKSDILMSLAQPNLPNNVVPTSVVLLVLAIGAQCRGLGPRDSAYASNLFTKGRIMSFEGMLCEPSVEMVAQFVLMAFYMLGACQRNAAFMYIGVASKAALALGLHRLDQYRDLPADEVRLR